MSVETPLFAAPAASAAPSAGGGLAEVTLALLAIVALIGGLAWLMKRMRGLGVAGHDRIQVLSERALGPKERCVLIRIGVTEMLIGVASGNVTTLHVFAEGAVTQAPAPPPAVPGASTPTFKDMLLRSLGK